MLHAHCAMLVILMAGVAPNTTACSPMTRLRVPAEEEIDRITPDPVHPEPIDYFKDFKIEKSDVLEILRDYDVVSEREWLNNYSHVAFGDRTGTITLRSGTKVQYMVRPGGLASLTFPDGRKLFLASRGVSDHEHAVDSSPATSAFRLDENRRVISLDTRIAPRQRRRFDLALGSITLETLHVKDNKLTFRYTPEVEGGYTVYECTVPVSPVPVEITFERNGTPGATSFDLMACKVIRRGNVHWE